jgi:DNA-binding NtrC family response regulator
MHIVRTEQMNTTGLNLFIVDDDPLVMMGLKNYLNHRFTNDINISTFTTGKSVLRAIDEHTSIVILDNLLEGRSGNEVLKLIKEINANTEVIMLTSNEDIGMAIDAFRNGAKDYVIKGKNAKRNISDIVLSIITYPIRILIREFGISKYLAIFLLTFAIMGIGVFIALRTVF